MICAVVLRKIDDFDSIAEGPAGKKVIDCGPVDTVHFIPGNSTINSAGKGNVVCFVVFYGSLSQPGESSEASISIQPTTKAI